MAGFLAGPSDAGACSWVFVVVDSLVLHSVRSAIRRVLEQVVLQEEYEAESLADHLENVRRRQLTIQ